MIAIRIGCHSTIPMMIAKNENNIQRDCSSMEDSSADAVITGLIVYASKSSFANTFNSIFHTHTHTNSTYIQYINKHKQMSYLTIFYPFTHINIFTFIINIRLSPIDIFPFNNAIIIQQPSAIGDTHMHCILHTIE